MTRYWTKRPADALELEDKRIAEEREQHDIMMERGAEKLAEAERKLDVAREALKQIFARLGPRFLCCRNHNSRRSTSAQIGGEDV